MEIHNGTNEGDKTSHDWDTGDWFLVEQNSKWNGEDIDFKLVVYDGPTFEDDIEIEYKNTFEPEFDTDARGIMIYDHHDGENHTWDRIFVEPDGAIID